MRNLAHPHSISEESLDTFLTGQTSVGTSAVALSETDGQVARKSVKIKALAANTGKVYVGAGNVSTSNGYELAAGVELELKVYDLTTIYLVASASSQGVCWIAV